LAWDRFDSEPVTEWLRKLTTTKNGRGLFWNIPDLNKITKFLNINTALNQICDFNNRKNFQIDSNTLDGNVDIIIKHKICHISVK